MSFFDNAKQVMIGSKEVALMKMGNKTLYEKVRGNTVTFKMKVADGVDYKDEQLVNGLGCYLLSSITDVPNSVSSIPYYTLFSKSDYDLDQLVENNDFSFEITLDNVEAGDYYVVMCDYKDDGYPWCVDSTGYNGMSVLGNNNAVNKIGVSSSEMDSSTWEQGYITSSAPISVTDGGINTWYVDGYY